MEAPAQSRLMPWAIATSAVACVAADAAWLLSPDNQLAPDGSTRTAAAVGIALAAIGLVLAAVATIRSSRHIMWVVGFSALAIAASIGAVMRLSTLPYGH